MKTAFGFILSDSVCLFKRLSTLLVYAKENWEDMSHVEQKLIKGLVKDINSQIQRSK